MRTNLMNLEEKYFYYSYLKRFKIIEDILSQNEITSDIDYNDKSYTIKANLSFKEFSSIKQSLEEIIPKIYIKRLAISTYINMFDSDFGEAIRIKLEDSL